MEHDFEAFPELRNNEMEVYYFDSPHKQITEQIRVKVVKVHDGDTISVRWEKRDFDFPVRLAGINAPELNEAGGNEARDWLKNEILEEEVDLIPTEERVEKWGRLLARIISRGLDISEMMITLGLVKTWEARHEGKLMNINKEFNLKKWF